jgi:type I restriction enzyme S subunit
MGVNKLLLGDILFYEQPTKYIVADTNYSDEYPTPVLTAGKSFILGYTNEIEGIYTNLPVIIFDDFTTESKFVEFPFKVKSSAMKLLTVNKEIADIRYMFYLLKTLNVLSDQHKRYWISTYAKIEIDLPPLHIQEQIADTLDKADALRRKDQELLQKYDELAQSIFYDMFGDPETNPKEWPCLTLDKITYKLGDGLHGTPVYDEDGDYYFINGNNLIDGKITITPNTKKVSFTEFSKHKKDLNEDSILISINGTIGKVAFFNNEKIILGKSACYFNINRNRVVPQYIYHLLSSPYFIKYAMSEATGSTIKNVSLKTMRNLTVPLPPIELQKKFESYITLQKAGYLKHTAAIETENRLFQSLQTDYFS